MVNEIAAGQERGEIERAGGSPIVRDSDNGETTLDKLGVPRQRGGGSTRDPATGSTFAKAIEDHQASDSA